MTADDWRPIETAPKDVARVVLWCNYRYGPLKGNWIATGCWYNAGWRTIDGTPIYPTHWQPIVGPKTEGM